MSTVIAAADMFVCMDPRFEHSAGIQQACAACFEHLCVGPSLKSAVSCFSVQPPRPLSRPLRTCICLADTRAIKKNCVATNKCLRYS